MDSSGNSDVLLKTCRVCNKDDDYSNLFYNINRELLNNLMSLLQIEITELDGFSKFLCRECAEKVEEFINFRNKYEETSLKVRAMPEQESTLEVGAYKVEALDESFEVAMSPVDAMEDQTNAVEELMEADSARISSSTPNKTFQCSACSKVYLYPTSLTRHMKTAHDNVRHSCKFCGSQFTQRTSLSEHVKNLHNNEEPSEAFACTSTPFCHRVFNTAKMLHQHMRQHGRARARKQIKREEKPLKKYRKQCQICGLFFKHIDEHKLTHQTEKTFRCDHPECDKTFKFKTSLDVHIRIHKNERRFECPTCNKKFRVSHHLKEHMTVHSNEKSFACDAPLCSKKFSSKLNLYKHSKLHFNKSKA